MHPTAIFAAGFLILFVGGGARFAIGLTFKPMVTEFGWARGELGLAVGAYLVVSAFATYYAGRLADRTSPRVLLNAGVIISGIKRLASPISGLLHDLACLYSTPLDVAAIAAKRIEDLGWDPPAFRSRQHDAGQIIFAFAQDVDQRLAVECQRERLPHLCIVERGNLQIDDQIGRDIGRSKLADRFRRVGPDVFEQWDRYVRYERHIELARYECQDPG